MHRSVRDLELQVPVASKSRHPWVFPGRCVQRHVRVYIIVYADTAHQWLGSHNKDSGRFTRWAYRWAARPMTRATRSIKTCTLGYLRLPSVNAVISLSVWLAGVTVKTLGLGSRDRGFNSQSRSDLYLVVATWPGDCLQTS